MRRRKRKKKDAAVSRNGKWQLVMTVCYVQLQRDLTPLPLLLNVSSIDVTNTRVPGRNQHFQGFFLSPLWGAAGGAHMGAIHAVDIFKNPIRWSQITLGIVGNGITVYENADSRIWFLASLPSVRREERWFVSLRSKIIHRWAREKRDRRAAILGVSELITSLVCRDLSALADQD